MQHQRKVYVDIQLPLQAPWLIKSFPLEELYINLEMHKVKGENEDVGKCIQVEQIFDPVENKVPKRILVEGAPGMGKTTLCWKLLNDYELNKDYLVSNFKMIFLVLLRDFQDNESIEDILIDAYKWSDYSPANILSCIDRYQKEVLLILDGYDELSEAGKKKLLPLLKKEKFPSMRVIVTSRSGTLRMKREKGAAVEEAFQLIDKETRELKFFNKRIVIKGVKEEKVGVFLSKYLGKTPTEAEEKINSIIEGDMAEIGKCPLLLLLLGTMIEEKQFEIISSKTSMYKSFFNFIIRRNLVREKLLEVETQIDIFESCENLARTEILTRFGKIAVDNLITDSLIFNERKVLSHCKDEIIFKLGFLNKTTKPAKHSHEVFYEPIHKSFIEFSAALYIYQVLLESGEDAFKREIERVVITEGLLPTDDSLFFPFIGGLLNGRASLLFEALLPLSSWFNLEDLCFSDTLQEIDDINTFFDNFRPLVPSFVPSFYFVGCFYNTKFYSLPIHSLILNNALESNVIQILEWDPSSSLSLKENIIISHLRLYFDNNANNENVICQENLRCQTLSFRFTGSFNSEYWPNVVRLIRPIDTDEICFHFYEGESGLNSALLKCFYTEITEGLWAEKTINRLIFKVTKGDDPNCLPLLVNLVRKEKITDGIRVRIDKSERSVQEQTEMKNNLENLFEAVVKSKNISDVYIFNQTTSISPVFDFNRFHGEEEIRFKSFYFRGSLIAINDNKNIKVSIEEAITLFGKDEMENSKFIQNLQGTKWLKCHVKCLESADNVCYQNLKELEEITLIVDESLHLNNSISNLKNLKVLTLNFRVLSKIPRGSKSFFNLVFSSLRLKVLQFNNIPRVISSFDRLVESVVNSLEEEKENSKLSYPLDEFLIYFNKRRENGFGWNDLKWSRGVKEIRRMLRKNLVRLFSLVDAYVDLPRSLPQSLFPKDEQFIIKVEVFGSEPLHSRNSQCHYRWLAMSHKYCITSITE